MHSWFVCTLRTKKTERTLRTKKPKAHFYFPEIKYKVTIHNTHISVNKRQKVNTRMTYTCVKCRDLSFIQHNKNETKGYPTPCFMQLHKCSYNHQGINLIP